MPPFLYILSSSSDKTPSWKGASAHSTKHIQSPSKTYHLPPCFTGHNNVMLRPFNAQLLSYYKGHDALLRLYIVYTSSAEHQHITTAKQLQSITLCSTPTVYWMGHNFMLRPSLHLQLVLVMRDTTYCWDLLFCIHPQPSLGLAPILEKKIYIVRLRRRGGVVEAATFNEA